MKVVALRVGWPADPGDDARYVELLMEEGDLVQLEITSEDAQRLARELTVRPPASYPAGVQ